PYRDPAPRAGRQVRPGNLHRLRCGRAHPGHPRECPAASFAGEPRNSEVDCYATREIQRVKIQCVRLALDERDATAMGALAQGEILIATVRSAPTDDLVVLKGRFGYCIRDDRHRRLAHDWVTHGGYIAEAAPHPRRSRDLSPQERGEVLAGPNR